MSVPRFVPVQGVIRSGVCVPAWPAAGEPLLGAPAPDSRWLSWRLLGANNRELGRSAHVYPDAPSAIAAILFLEASAPVARATVEVDLSSGLWAWRLTHDGARVAVSGRAYRRQRECRYSLEMFQDRSAEALADFSAPDWRGAVSSSTRSRRNPHRDPPRSFSVLAS